MPCEYNSDVPPEALTEQTEIQQWKLQWRTNIYKSDLTKTAVPKGQKTPLFFKAIISNYFSTRYIDDFLNKLLRKSLFAQMNK